jgi:hypothetical protein
MLDPTPLASGAAYATVADIRDCADLPEMPCTPAILRVDGALEPLWTRPDGTPLTILVRGLSFAERREANQAAGDNDDQFKLEVCLRGIKVPRFTREQLTAILEAKHPAALDAIFDTIKDLCTLPAGLVEREVRRLAGLPAEKPPGQGSTAVGGDMDAATRPKVQRPARRTRKPQ